MRSTFVRQSLAGLRLLLVLTVLTGVSYPAAVWSMAHLPGLAHRAEGSLVTRDGRPVGSEMVGIDPVDPHAAVDPSSDRYFHTRPSASGDPASTGGSNLAGDNPKLLTAVEQRKAAIAHRDQVEPKQVPPDAVTASASGVDPQISTAYAQLQAPRVARVNGLPEQQVRALIEEHARGRAGGFLGEPTTTVLDLNTAIADATHHDP